VHHEEFLAFLRNMARKQSAQQNGLSR
jgi:hypothetical protein